MTRCQWVKDDCTAFSTRISILDGGNSLNQVTIVLGKLGCCSRKKSDRSRGESWQSKLWAEERLVGSYLLETKKPKNLIQQGFYIYAAGLTFYLSD